MIAAIEMQWLVIGVAALVVAVLLIIVLVRQRGGDERLMTEAPSAWPASPPAGPPAGPPPDWAGLGAAAAQREPGAPTATPRMQTAAPAAQTRAAAAPPTAPAGSFLDEPLARNFEGLGRPHAPASAPAPAPAPAPASSGPYPVDPFGSHEDIFPPQAPAAERAPAIEPAPSAGVAVGVERAPIAEPEGSKAAPVAEAAPAEAATAEAAPPAPGDETAAGRPATADAPALLSDVIVTNSHEEVDLADPDVRALLVSLVDDEIGLAKVCRAQGQVLDAILQLTEAEKTCAALGLDDSLAEVKALLAELQG